MDGGVKPVYDIDISDASHTFGDRLKGVEAYPQQRGGGKENAMNKAKAHSKGAAVVAAFDVTGEALLLQLLFVVISVPLVTMLPAAVALQRSFRQVILEDKPGTFRRFMSEFSWAWKRLALAGIATALLAVVAAFSILFWLSTPGALGTAALCVIIPLCGAAAGLYLALLAAAMEADNETSGRNLWEAALQLVLRRPLPLGGCVIGLATWGVLALRLPTLIPLGSGLVPALLAWLLVRRQVSAKSHIAG
jgi:uncharacterized membrane protein YesL